MKKTIILIKLLWIAVVCISQTTFGPQQIINYDAENPVQVFSCDLDNDGDNDVLFAASFGDNIAWHENDGQGNFGPTQYIDGGLENTKDVFSCDLDNDNDFDVLSVSYFYNRVVWYENFGNGNFSDEQIVSNDADEPKKVYAHDLNSDGDKDVICTLNFSLVWYENYGNQTFANAQVISDDEYNYAIHPIDMDNDGDYDIISASWKNLPQSDILCWYENDGYGDFSNQNIISTGDEGIYCVNSVDLDNDGDLDVICASSTIFWYPNDGDGNFGNKVIISTEASVTKSIFPIDLDNDGDYDLLAASLGEDILAWYENDGFGVFSVPQIIDEGYDANSVFSIDLDSDGDNDVISCGDGWADEIWTFENYRYRISSSDLVLCEGDSLYILETWITSPGIYQDTIPNSFGGDSILVYNVSLYLNPGEFQISGPIEVDEFEIAIYSVPINTEVIYNFEVENGNILSSQTNYIEVQWGTNGMGLVKAIATFPETGCDTESILYVSVGTNRITNNTYSEVTLFPNPANNTLFIESEISPVFIEIINNTGLVVKKSNFSKIDISDLESSTYIVKVFDKQRNILQLEKLIIIR